MQWWQRAHSDGRLGLDESTTGIPEIYATISDGAHPPCSGSQGRALKGGREDAASLDRPCACASQPATAHRAAVPRNREVTAAGFGAATGADVAARSASRSCAGRAGDQTRGEHHDHPV
jgi:hypothetical protein